MRTSFRVVMSNGFNHPLGIVAENILAIQSGFFRRTTERFDFLVNEEGQP
jgi:hypothetical protein